MSRRVLLGSALLITLYAVVGGVARIAQDAAIAWRHGIGPLVDAFYLLVSVVSWPAALLLSTLTLLITPLEAALAARSPAERQAFRAEMLGWALLLAALSWPLASLVLQAWASGAAREGALAMAAAVPLGLLAALLTAWLVSAGRETATLAEALPACVVVAIVIAAPAAGLFIAWPLGLALQLLAAALWLRAAGELPRPRLGLRAGGWHAFGRDAPLLLAGQALFALTPLVDPLLASRLGEGAVAELSIASRLVLGLLGLLGLTLQRAGLPLLSRLAASDPASARRAAWRWAAGAGALGAAGGLLVALLAEPLVALLFERGRFTGHDSAQVAALLRWGMLQLPIYLAGTAVVTALAALGGARWLAAVAITGFAVKLAASLSLAAVFGAAGLMLATALMYIATSSLAAFALRRRVAAAAAR